MYSAMYGGRSGRAKGKQTKSKKNKHKCSLCNTKGHNEEDCPDKEEALARQPSKNSGGAGSGISHKTSRKASKKDEDDKNDNTTLQLVEGFYTRKDVTSSDDPFLYFDAGCDVGATLDTLTALKKSKANTPKSMYGAAMEESASNYGGCVCRQYLKPNRPWNPEGARNVEMMDAEPHIYYVLGLGPRFFLDETQVDDDDDDDDSEDEEDDLEDEDQDEDNTPGIEALTDAIESDDLVLGFCAKLDYTPSVLKLPGYDKRTQLRRFRATCSAALQMDVPLQCRIAPNATADDEEGEDNSKDPYVAVVKDLAKVLLEMSPNDEQKKNPLKVHLVSWSGKSKHMMSLLQAFPDTLYIGMSASVGFTKSALSHECAFDVPLNRLLLETDNIIPTIVATTLGRTAFSHSGHIPYCAAHVAELKKTVDAVDVARVASENTVQLYGRGIALRAQEAAAQAEATLAEANLQREQDAAAAAALEEEEALLYYNGGDPEQPKEYVETRREKKKKKKKRGGQQQQQDGGEDAEANFDDDILASLVDEM